MPASHAPSIALAILLTLLLPGCADAPERDAAEDPSDTPHATSAEDAAPRPDRLLDTLTVEGMAEPVELRLFSTPEDFPLPFSAYVPRDMVISTDPSGVVDFVAEFGGTRDDDTFMHLYVFPRDTPWQEALATAKGYKTSRGIPVSRGIEIIADELGVPDLPWAEEAYRYRYQSGGAWYGGMLGVGLHRDTPFMIVTHRPVDSAEGFAPRAERIRATWRWSDGTALR